MWKIVANIFIFLQAKDDELEQAVEAALDAGYRHIDTAHVYENEGIIGKVLNRWIGSGKVKRKYCVETIY